MMLVSTYTCKRWYLYPDDIAGTVEVQVGEEALEDTILGLVPAHVLYPQCGPTLVQYLTLAPQGKTHCS